MARQGSWALQVKVVAPVDGHRYAEPQQPCVRELNFRSNELHHHRPIWPVVGDDLQLHNVLLWPRVLSLCLLNFLPQHRHEGCPATTLQVGNREPNRGAASSQARRRRWGCDRRLHHVRVR